MSFDRLGRFAVRRRWWIVAAWAVLILLALPLAPRAPGALSAGGFILDDLESARAKQVLQAELGLEPSALRAGLHVGHAHGRHARRGSPRSRRRRGRGRRAARHPGPDPRPRPRQVSADGRTAYDVVFLDLPPDDSPDAIPPVAAALHEVPGLTVRIAGGPAFYGDVQAVTETDLRRSELISLPLAALGAAPRVRQRRRGGRAARRRRHGRPRRARRRSSPCASLTPMSIFVLNLATLLGLGLGVDYSLLMTSRFREELRPPRGPGPRRRRPSGSPSPRPAAPCSSPA